MSMVIEGRAYYDIDEVGQLINLSKNFAIQWLRQNGIRPSLRGPHLAVRAQKQSSALTLSDREIEILTSVAKGELNKEIANRLGLSYQTIKNHMTSILKKLNAGSRTEATCIAIKCGLISIN
jgi:DNA-binding NarL/FixJ family response regulator